MRQPVILMRVGLKFGSEIIVCIKVFNPYLCTPFLRMQYN